MNKAVKVILILVVSVVVIKIGFRAASDPDAYIESIEQSEKEFDAAIDAAASE